MSNTAPEATPRALRAYRGFDEAPDDALVPVGTVALLTASTTPTVWRRCRKGALPAPVKVGRATLWRVGDLRAALAKQAA